MKYKIKLNLQTKWTIYIAMIVIFVASFGIFLNLWHNIREGKAKLREKGIILAGNLAYTSRYGVLTGNQEILSDYLKGIMKMKDVSSAVIFDSKGEILAQKYRYSEQIESHVCSYNEILASRSYLDIVFPIKSEEKDEEADESSLFLTNDELINLPADKEDPLSDCQESTLFENTFDEKEKTIGAVFIKMFDKNTIAEIRKIVTISILSGLFIMLAVVGVVILLVRKMVKPIYLLAEATQIVAKGDFNVNVDIQREDELGMLGKSFNRMIKELRDTTVSRDTLMKEVEEREKAEENLRIYAEQLEKTNKELDGFIHIISHDLKEPLRSIDAYSRFIKKDFNDTLNNEGKDYLERIKFNADRIQLLIDTVYEMSRINKANARYENIDIEDLVKEVKDRLVHEITKKNAEIIIKDKLPVVFCDRRQMEEVFLNLISNAIKFSDKQKPVIEIGSSQNNGKCSFYIKDNGPGIEEKYHDKIFVIFQRLSRKEDFEGTGAGLAIVKKIVEIHDGTIRVESEMGKGSTFIFSILQNQTGEHLLNKK